MTEIGIIIEQGTEVKILLLTSFWELAEIYFWNRFYLRLNIILNSGVVRNFRRIMDFFWYGIIFWFVLFKRGGVTQSSPHFGNATDLYISVKIERLKLAKVKQIIRIRITWLFHSLHSDWIHLLEWNFLLFTEAFSSQFLTLMSLL